MGMRRMMFEIPDDVADRFDADVPAAEQSVFVAGLLQRRPSRPALTDEQWARVCEIANHDPETQQIQAEFGALPDTMIEAWNDDSDPR